MDQLDLSLTPLEFFASRFPGSTAPEYRAHMGRYGISGERECEKEGEREEVERESLGGWKKR
jgi:hypothetical protein